MKNIWSLLFLIAFLFTQQNLIAQERTLQNAINNAKAKPDAVIAVSETTTTIASNCEGDCTDGWGKMMYQNGSYTGFWKNGLKSGYGLYRWNEGDKYEGSWLNDVKTGFGSYFYSNGDTYEGYFKNELKNGLGRYWYEKDKLTSFDEYRDGKIIKNFKMESNLVTTGCINGDCEEGFGIYLFGSGNTFQGEFVKGKFKRGRYDFVNGDSYSGEFNVNNRFEGYGIYIFANEVGQYVGNWVNGKRFGRGISYYNNMTQLGEWENDKLIKSLDN